MNSLFDVSELVFGLVHHAELGVHLLFTSSGSALGQDGVLVRGAVRRSSWKSFGGKHVIQLLCVSGVGSTGFDVGTDLEVGGITWSDVVNTIANTGLSVVGVDLDEGWRPWG